MTGVIPNKDIKIFSRDVSPILKSNKSRVMSMIEYQQISEYQSIPPQYQQIPIQYPIGKPYSVVPVSELSKNIPYEYATELPSSSPSSVADNHIHINGYDIIRILGSGAFGIVTHVTRQSDNSNFVIKILQKNRVPRFVFQNEINILQQVQLYCTEYLLCYIGADETPDYYLIFMEYLENYMTLREFLKQITIDVRPEQLLLTITCNLVSGLKKLHGIGIAHRDIKADNIMISPKGNIKFIDFGLACDSLTFNKQPISGTITYLAPELLISSPTSIEGWQLADIWSLGMVIYNISNLISYPDEIFAKLTSIKFMRDINHKHVLSYILGAVSNGDLDWLKTLKWRHPIIISLLNGLLQVDPNKRYIPDIRINYDNSRM